MLAASCGKDVDVFTPVVSGDVDVFFQAVQPVSFQYELQAGTSHELTLPSKGKLTVPANAFVSSTGQPISGTVLLDVSELTDKADLLSSRLGSTADGMLVDAVATLRIEATQSGQRLLLAPEKAIKVSVVAENYSNDLKLFQGDGSEGAFSWWENKNGMAPIAPTEVWDEESSAFLEGIAFESTRLGWMQCGQYLNEEFGQGGAQLCVELPVGFSEENTAIFVAFRNFDTVIKVNDFENGLPQVCRDNLLSGYWADVIVVAQAGDDGAFYLAKDFLVIEENTSVEIIPALQTLPEIIAVLEQL